MNTLNDHLNQRAEELMVFNMPKNKDLMEEIFSFDPRNIEITSSEKISQYAIGLAQFLVYFTSQINSSKVKLIQKKRIIDLYVNKSDIKAKTKSEKYIKVVESNVELKKIETDLEALECELQMTENLEKYYIELINAFKRELGRREFEMKFNRYERTA